MIHGTKHCLNNYIITYISRPSRFCEIFINECMYRFICTYIGRCIHICVWLGAKKNKQINRNIDKWIDIQIERYPSYQIFEYIEKKWKKSTT